MLRGRECQKSQGRVSIKKIKNKNKLRRELLKDIGLRWGWKRIVDERESKKENSKIKKAEKN